VLGVWHLLTKLLFWIFHSAPSGSQVAGLAVTETRDFIRGMRPNLYFIRGMWPNLYFIRGMWPNLYFIRGMRPNLYFVRGMWPNVYFIRGMWPNVYFIRGMWPNVYFIRGMWPNLYHFTLLAIKKHGIQLQWPERQAVRYLIVDHLTPGAKRSGVSGTYHELINFILVFIYLFVV
jgi:hypothetical protein